MITLLALWIVSAAFLLADAWVREYEDRHPPVVEWVVRLREDCLFPDCVAPWRSSSAMVMCGADIEDEETALPD